MFFKLLLLLVCTCLSLPSFAWEDTDKDGVPDKKDACPETPMGVVVLANGCQEISDLIPKSELQNLDMQQNKISHVSSKQGLKIYFDFGHEDVLTTQLPTIEKMLPLLRESQNILLVGHTDNVGSEQINLNLSLQRALSVKKVLVNQFDFEPSGLAVLGKGSLEPAVENNTAQQRQLNRRVEFVVKK
ncbi:OmpA family protein [uncultured Shewanella sp.]|uniref:OmpA family protein n=1 Tax=uncultured Shewanella sp. TaxID=173975 RepID=UPI00262F372C|nr:OmpA family protein [uncultured Shewanella sp.]